MVLPERRCRESSRGESLGKQMENGNQGKIKIYRKRGMFRRIRDGMILMLLFNYFLVELKKKKRAQIEVCIGIVYFG